MTHMPLSDLFAEASRLETLGQQGKVADLYKSWMAANPSDALLHGVYFNYSVALARLGDRAGAINTLRECIRLKPDFYPPYLNLGRLLEDAGQIGPAVSQWLTFVNSTAAINGDAVRHKLMVLQQLGRVLEGAHRDAPAEDALRQSLDLKPDQPEVVQHWIALRQRQCKWPVIQGWEGVPASGLLAGISPLSTAVMLDDPMFQLARGYQYARDSVRIPADPPQGRVARARVAGDKLRIGYVSSDLREHAVGFGLAEVMELHDRERFAIHAYYCGISRTDPTQARIKAAVDDWTDITGLDDDAAAARMAADGIDILVDLNGYTRDARTAVFARKPAPVIVNWFGFPGSMGTPYHHYIIGDHAVIPPGDEIYYSEKVLRLPCYQPNDRRRAVSTEPVTRADEGLPEEGFVFCCLNGMQKITSQVFERWMQILARVPASVLWLLGSGPETNAHLRTMAAAQGVDPARLVFAEKRPNPQHLARYRLADLFLDTFPYGAHTTAADALWMGVPVLTLPGRTFASRVCAGLVTAAGLPELVCASSADYVEKAVALGHTPRRAADLGATLRVNRETSLLFDTPRLVESLERLFDEMWQDAVAGRIPQPNLANLDVYGQIGVELNLTAGGEAADASYEERYVNRLRRWHGTYPLPADGRLWHGRS